MGGNSKQEGEEMLLLMLLTFVVVVGHSGHMLFVMYAAVTALTDKVYLGHINNKS
jgi:hypothetical protein